MAANRWMVVAMLMPVAEVCGLHGTFQAEHIAAMRIVSVTPPVLERSGCAKRTAPSSSSRVKSKRV